MTDEAEKGGKSRKTKAVVDRIEDGGRAVVQLGDDAADLVELPASLLPEGAAGGDHLTITVKLDGAGRASAEARIRALQDRLERRTRGE